MRHKAQWYKKCREKFHLTRNYFCSRTENQLQNNNHVPILKQCVYDQQIKGFYSRHGLICFFCNTPAGNAEWRPSASKDEGADRLHDIIAFAVLVIYMEYLLAD